MGRKLGVVLFWGRGTRVPIYCNVAVTEAYVPAKFHLDPLNRLAAIYQHYRQGRQKRSDSIGRTVLQPFTHKHRKQKTWWQFVCQEGTITV